MKNYNDEMFEVMIKHAGHEVLAEAAGGFDKSASVSDEFSRKIHATIGRQAAGRSAQKVLKVFLRVAAVIAVLIVISAAVIFSSEALRTKAMNLFSAINGDKMSIHFYSADKELPEGIVLPGYLPKGFDLIEAKGNEGCITSLYENGSGGSVSISQLPLSGGMDIGVDQEHSYEVEIAGRKAIVVEADGCADVFFCNDEYSFEIFGNIEVSQLLIVAESMLL